MPSVLPPTMGNNIVTYLPPPSSFDPFLRFPLWEFHVKAIRFHVRVSFDKTSQLLRRFGIRLSFLNKITKF